MQEGCGNMESEDLYNRLNYLVTEAKFTFWPMLDENGKDTGNHGYPDNQVKLLDTWRIVWLSPEKMPTFDELKNVDASKLNASILLNKKKARNKMHADQISTIGAYVEARGRNNRLTFSEYLDAMEVEQENIKKQI